jgi:hypothetical protein
MRRQSVQHHANTLGLRIVNVAELAHAVSEILRRAPLCDFHVGPRAMGVEKHKEVARAFAPVFAVEA